MKEETISIETPEKIRFHYRIAPTGARIGAYIIDLLIQILVAVLLILLALFSGSGFATFSNRLGNDFQALAMAFLYLVYFFFQWGYFTFFELLKNGQTPGKKAMRICVIKADGESPDASTIVLRNLLRAVDAFPAFHFLGGLVSILDKKSRRLGDIVADTIVVHEIRFQLEEPAFKTKLKSSGMKEPDFAPNVKLNEEELYVIRRFLN
ncbi:MAG: RDD family protein, partial [bacterium]|nr:RDD family protein [bacterium]